MTLDSFLKVLAANPAAAIHLMLPDQSFVPAHFHVTEVGRVQKDFIDCGGTTRSTTTCVLQVWVAGDIDHRLDTSKLAKVMQLAAPLLKSTDLPVEVEYGNRNGVAISRHRGRGDAVRNSVLPGHQAHRLPGPGSMRYRRG